MTVAQGRPCLQGLEWSSICGPEAGSVPTVPWQENVQPSQPRQLGYSQGAMENWRAAAQRWSWGSLEEEGKGWWVRNKVFHIILVLQGHGICCVRWAKPNLGWWWGLLVPMLVYSDSVYHLAGMSGGGGSQNSEPLLHILKVLVYASTAIPCFSDDEFFKGWNWIIHLSLKRNLNRNDVLWLMGQHKHSSTMIFLTCTFFSTAPQQHALDCMAHLHWQTIVTISEFP